jgi:hypothetical protein
MIVISCLLLKKVGKKKKKKKKKHLEKVENAAPQIFGFFSQRVK